MSVVEAAAATLVGGTLGAGVAAQLRAGRYRLADDVCRLPLTACWSVAAAVAVAWGLLVARSTVLALLPAALIFAAAAAWVVWIDLDVQRISDRLLAVATPLVAAAGWTGAAVVGQWWRVWTSLAAGVVLMTLYFVLALVGSMGLGDVKLAGLVGLLLGLHGWSTVALGSVLAFAVGGIAAVLLLARGAGRKDLFAFGPAMIVGALLAVAVR